MTRRIYFDGHNDTFKKCYLHDRDFCEGNDFGHLDLPKAVSSGMAGGFFALNIGPENPEEREFGYGLTLTEDGWSVDYPRPLSFSYAETFNNNLFSFIEEMVNSNDGIEIAKSFSDITEGLDKDIYTIVLHFEGAEAIKSDLSNLDHYYRRGLRSLGIVWSRPNVFGDGVPFRFPSGCDIGPGLKDAGKALLERCQELGIIVDVAHLNWKGFQDVVDIYRNPIVCSHAAVSNICSSSTNLNDAHLTAIARSGGVIGIIFDVLNTRPDGRLDHDCSIDLFVEHIDYIINKIGSDHVAIGSDFDGAQTPNCLKNVLDVSLLWNALKDRGYSEEIIDRIAYKNWFRVIQEIWI